MPPWARALAILVSTVLIAGAALAAWWLRRPLELAHPAVEVSIEPGTSVREIVRLWREAGVVAPPQALYQWFRWSGQARRIRAGSYEIERGATPWSLLMMMVRGDETLMTVRFIEGWNMRQVRAELLAAPGLKPVSAGWSDAELMRALGAPGQSAEGRFFPDTYAYSRGVSDLAVLRRAHAALERQLQEAWGLRAADSPLTSPDQALVLASVIEKETGDAGDRGRVAGVFVNRLRVGMPLQSDPTVIYGLGPGFDGRLRKSDLLRDTPYNTYTRAGLPPTPIALISLDALHAALRPDPTRALYFVSRGDGTSEFSDTLDAHHRAVEHYIKGTTP